jgi:hypothetical protein
VANLFDPEHRHLAYAHSNIFHHEAEAAPKRLSYGHGMSAGSMPLPLLSLADLWQSPRHLAPSNDRKQTFVSFAIQPHVKPDAKYWIRYAQLLAQATFSAMGRRGRGKLV